MLLYSIATTRKLQAALAACVFSGLLLSSSLSTSVQAADQSDVSTRMARMEAQMDTLSRAVFKGETPPAGSMVPLSGSSSDYQASVETRLSDLEKQNRDLTGKVEQLTFENNQLKTRLDKALADIELRFQGQNGVAPTGGMTSGMTSSTVTPNAAQQGATVSPTDDMSDVPPPKQSGTLAPQDMGGPVLSAPAPAATPSTMVDHPAPQKDINAPAPGNSPTVKQLGALNEAPGGASIAPDVTKDATAQYEGAFSQLKSGNYAPARVGFEDFLKNNPTHPLAANATYWLGESYYGQGQYDKAARVFAESYKKYPQGPKVADSLLKMGMSLGAGGKKKEACVTLQQLKKEFPSGQGVTLRRADQEMKKLGCDS